MADPTMQNIFIWVAVGGLFGWIADAAFNATKLGAFGNIMAGIVGAAIAAFVVDYFAINVQLGNAFFNSLLVSFIGAITLLSLLAAAESAAK